MAINTKTTRNRKIRQIVIGWDDVDIENWLDDNLTVPFSMYVKRLIRKDMDKGSTDATDTIEAMDEKLEEILKMLKKGVAPANAPKAKKPTADEITTEKQRRINNMFGEGRA